MKSVSLAALILFAGAIAQAAPSTGARTVRVDVPQSSFQERDSEVSQASRFEFELGSVMADEGVILPSWSATATPFRPDVLPRLSVAILPQLSVGRIGTLSGRLGASFAALSRTGEVSIGFASTSGTQALYWVGGAVGAQFEPAVLSGSQGSVYVSLVVRPHAAFVTNSLLGGSDSAFGLGQEAAIGGTYRFSDAIAVIGANELTAGLSYSRARLGEGRVSGLGFHGGVRWAL